MSGKILIQFFFIVAQTTLKMTSTQKNIAQDIYRLHSQTTQKFPNSHITFSTLLSQNDKLNGKAQDVNKLIIQNCASLNVQLICHSWTLSVPPSRPILHDNKHLNRFAVLLFARALTRAVYPGVSEPIHVVRETDCNQDNHQSNRCYTKTKTFCPLHKKCY